MTPEQLQQELQQGIAALKAGQRDEARERLTAVISADEQNEKAWLWLSGAVDSNDDRRICLENVLTINPNNATAKRGLTKLPPAASTATTNQASSQTSSRAPVSTASAILHPERYEAAPSQPPPPTTAPAPIPNQVAIIATSSYDDVWSRNEELCPYCAHPVDKLQNNCPGCGKNLIVNQFRYPDPSINLVLYWVLLAGIGQIFMLKVIFLIIVERRTVPAIVNGIFIIIFFVLAAGVNFRQPWALYGSYVVLGALLLFSFMTMFTPLDLSQVGAIQINENTGAVIGGLVNRFGAFLDIFLLTAVILALFYGIARAGTDFERVRSRQIAIVHKGMRDPATLSATARRLAKSQMWAAAILHWQRAAAKEPTRWNHQLSLGQAYARLGFYERALDALQSARKLTTLPERQAEIDAIITAVSEKQASVQTATTE